MKETDETLDRVLRRLGSEQAPPGMEARILQRLNAHALQPPRRRAHVLVRAWAPALGLIAGAACVFAAVLLHGGHAHRHARSAAGLYSASTAMVQHAQPAAGTDLATLPMRRARVHAAALRHSVTRDLPAWKAASFPAPPMPLTRQEKLLVVVARSRNRDSMKLLDQHAQAAEMARADAQFNSFFYQPTAEELEKHAK